MVSRKPIVVSSRYTQKHYSRHFECNGDISTTTKKAAGFIAFCDASYK